MIMFKNKKAKLFNNKKGNEMENKENTEKETEQSKVQDSKEQTTDTAKQENDQNTDNKEPEMNQKAEETKSEPEATQKVEIDWEQKYKELNDRHLRLNAEYDNYRKRTSKEKADMIKTAGEKIISDILPVVDNFERGLATIPEEEKGSAFAEGMEMIYKQLLGELEKMDVKPIPAVGEEFNPDFHNAVMQVESEEFESGVVAQELLKGYTYRDNVVRHSMVAVVS